MDVFKEIVINKNVKEIQNNIYLSSERIIDTIDTIQNKTLEEVDQFKAIFRLIFTFMIASTSLLPGTIITSEQNGAFMKVGTIFKKYGYNYPLINQENIKLLFDSPQAIAMINNATINTVVKEHGVKELWEMFKISVIDFRMFAFDYLNVAYSLSKLKEHKGNNYNLDMYNAIKNNFKKEFGLTFDEDDLEIYEFRTDIDIA